MNCDPESHLPVPCFLLARGAAGAGHPGVPLWPLCSWAAVRGLLGGSDPGWPLVSVSSSLPLSDHIGAADWGSSN